jgi:hypothetical protein
MTAGKTALSVVAAAVYATLTEDADHLALVPGGVCDHAPQDPAFPFEALADFDEAPRDTMTLQGRTVTFTLHIWSTYAGMAEAYTILDAAVALLRYQPLTLTGWECEAVFFDGAFQADPELVDGLEIQHVVAKFRVLVMED